MESYFDIKLENEYLRIVYEIILTNLRNNKKILEKELILIKNKYESLCKKENKNKEEMLNNIKKLKNKIEKIKIKYKEIDKKEEELFYEFEKRLNNLEDIEKNNKNLDKIKSFTESKINTILLDYLFREKFIETTKNLQNEENINENIEFNVLNQLENLIYNIKKKNLEFILKWSQNNKNKLNKLKSDIQFKIISQIFIERYKENKILECINFAKENFKNWSETHKKEICELMLLLAIKDKSKIKIDKYKLLLSDNKWETLEKDIIETFYQIYSLDSKSMLEILFQSGLISLKTPFCYDENNKKNINCPICSNEITKLSKDLPYFNHQVSHIICRITDEIMDETNPPLSLPNGQVYCEKAINEQINANNKFVDPVSNKEYQLNECKKVYIS